MNPAALAEAVRAAAVRVLDAHGLDVARVPAAVTVERPRDPSHGDYATNLAMRVAGKVGVAPRDLADWLADELAATPGLSSADAAEPGFVNVRVATAALGSVIAQVLADGADYGRVPAFRGADATREAALVDAIGADAARYALIRTPTDSTVDIDLDLWTRHNSDNPAYHVRYAHARACALLRNGADLGAGGTAGSTTVDFGLLAHEREGGLIRTLGEFPRVAATAAELREPHRVARYLEELAGEFHRFTDACRVLPMGDEDPGPQHAARLALCAATRQVLANGLALLGVTAPERM